MLVNETILVGGSAGLAVEQIKAARDNALVYMITHDAY
jgi:hypothetical protein